MLRAGKGEDTVAFRGMEECSTPAERAETAEKHHEAASPALAFDTEVPEQIYQALWLEDGHGASSAAPVTDALDAAWANGWRIGAVAYSRVLSPVAAAWSARIRTRLKVPGLRVARPIYSTDGRFVVAGWRADSWVQGVLSRRIDETVAAALRLDSVLAGHSIPEHALLAPEECTDPYSRADRLAAQTTLHPQDDVAVHRALTAIPAAAQLCHADMLGTTIYSGANPPVLTDVVATARPRGYTAALAMVDGLLGSFVDEGIIDRYVDEIPHLRTLMLLGLRYRIILDAELRAISAGDSSVFERYEKAEELINAARVATPILGEKEFRSNIERVREAIVTRTV